MVIVFTDPDLEGRGASKLLDQVTPTCQNEDRP